MPEPRRDFAACVVGGDIFVFGGCSTHFEAHATVFKYDTDADAWSTLGPMSDTDSEIHASVPDGQVYLLGAGANGHAVLRFDPASEAWTTLAPSLASPHNGTSFVLGAFLYAVEGGGDARVERCDPVTDTWSAVTDMLESWWRCEAATIGSAGPAVEQDFFDALIAKAARFFFFCIASFSPALMKLQNKSAAKTLQNVYAF
jgi:hypothetical protein